MRLKPPSSLASPLVRPRSRQHLAPRLPTTHPSSRPPPFGPAETASFPTVGGLCARPLLLPRAAMAGTEVTVRTAATAAASVDAVVAAMVASALATRLLPSSPCLRRPGPQDNIPGPESYTPTPCRCLGPRTPASRDLTRHPPGILRGASTCRASGLHCPSQLPRRASIAAGRPRADARPPLRPQHWCDWRHR
jgi:hypothetical protein